MLSSIGSVFSKIGSSIGSAVSSAGSFLWDGTKKLGKTLGFLPEAVGSSAFSLGEKYLTDKYISRPQSEYAWDQSKQGSAVQWKREYGAYKRRYRDTMRDMRKAGLNPIMASSTGFNVGSGSSAYAPQAQMPHAPQASAAQTALAFNQAKKAKAETKKVSRETELVKRKAVTEIERAAQVRAQKGLMTQQEAESVQRVQNMLQQHAKMAYEMHELSSRGRLHDQQREQSVEMVKQVRTLTQRLKLEMKQLTKKSDLYNNSYGTVLTYLRETLGSLGALIQGLPANMLKYGF